jgi:hypothetical protein
MTNTKQVGEAIIGGKPTILRDIELIVIHCSATRMNRDLTVRDIDTAHRYLGYSRWGYHYYIRKSRRIERMCPEQDIGARTWTRYPQTQVTQEYKNR